MVYCGKPSRGCQMCRTRRIKCDETKPTCLQCRKSRRQCPGYKDDFDLVFRNETQATERRARRAVNTRKFSMQLASKRISSANEAAMTISGPNDTLQEPFSPQMLSYQNILTIPLEQQAMNWFLANWVLVPIEEANSPVTKGFLDYVVPLIKHEPAGSHLTAAFEAVSLASLSNRPETQMLLGISWQKYTKALSLVNRALADPAVQKSDQTLTAVMLLGLFETITLRKTNLAAWGTHIEGAVMLVKMRGKKQLRTKIGQALFHAVRQIMLVNCMSTSKSPELGVDWWVSKDNTQHASQRMVELVMRVTELRADVNRAMMLMPRTPQNATKIQDLMRRAEIIEAAFRDLLANIPEEMSFKTVAWMDTVPGQDPSESDIFPGKIDIYPDLIVATQWSSHRVARLLLAGIVIRCTAWVCSPIDYRTTPEYANASRLGADMISDMIASIPYHFGWIGDKGQFRTDAKSHFVCGQDGTGQAKALGAYLCVWPVFTIMCSDFATDGQRRYVTGRLKYMAERLGLGQASVLANFQLRLPSMIVKCDNAADKMLTAKMLAIQTKTQVISQSSPSSLAQSDPSGLAQPHLRTPSQSQLSNFSQPQIPGYAIHPAPTAGPGQPLRESHILDRSSAIQASLVPNPRPGLDFSRDMPNIQPENCSLERLAPTIPQQMDQSYLSTTWGPPGLIASSQDLSYITYVSPTHASPSSLSIGSSYSLTTSATPPRTTQISLTLPVSTPSLSNLPNFQPQVLTSQPRPQFPNQLQPSLEPRMPSTELNPPEPLNTDNLDYDHSMPPPRTIAEEIDEADESLKNEAERHHAERIAFRRGFGAVMSQVTGKDVVAGMYRNREAPKTRDNKDDGKRESFGVAGGT